MTAFQLPCVIFHERLLCITYVCETHACGYYANKFVYYETYLIAFPNLAVGS